MQPILTGEKTLPVRPGMFLETVSKVMQMLHHSFCVECIILEPSGHKIFGPVENFTRWTPDLFNHDTVSHTF